MNQKPQAVEDLDAWRLTVSDYGDGKLYASGIGLGVSQIISEQTSRVADAVALPGTAPVTLPYIPPSQIGAFPKPSKPFIIVDGVVYINASLIKENTL